MTRTQFLIRRAPITSATTVGLWLVFVFGVALGVGAARLFPPTPVGPLAYGGTTDNAAPAEAVSVYYQADRDLRAALARHDMVSAAGFRSHLRSLAGSGIVSALAHERVDLELGLAAAASWHDPRMAAEFRSRLATRAR